MQKMNYFVPNDTFNSAIENHKTGVLKALLISIIGYDPTFATSEYEEAIAYLKSQSELVHGRALQLNQPYKKQEDEYVSAPENWNEQYFQMLLVWYRDNFARERLQTIKDVGAKVYQNKLTLGKSKRKNELAQKIAKRHHNRPQKKTSGVAAKCEESETDFKITDWIKTNGWYFIVIAVVIVVLCFVL